MKRRVFAKSMILSLTGISLLPTLTGCSAKKFDLKPLIGKNSSPLMGKQKNGDNFFAYYIIEGDEVNSHIKAKKAMVFTKNEQIIGYTLVIDGVQAGEDTLKELRGNSGEPEKTIDNDYGSQWKWQKGERTIALTIGNVKNGLPPQTWLSEYMADTNLIVF